MQWGKWGLGAGGCDGNLMRSQPSEKEQADGGAGCRDWRGVGLSATPSPELRPVAELHGSLHLSTLEI